MQISPAEIEEIILHHPSVEEAVVVGVVDPDGGDRIPRAFVVLKQDSQNEAPDVIRTFVDNQVAPYKKLRGGLYVIPSLPKNKTGKISRVDCLALDVQAPAC